MLVAVSWAVEDVVLSLGHRKRGYYKSGFFIMMVMATELLAAVGWIRMD